MVLTLEKEVIRLRKENQALREEGISDRSDKALLMMALQNSETNQELLRQHYNDEFERLRISYMQALRHRFGRRTERFVDEENPQQPLFDSIAPTQSSEPIAAEDEEVITHKKPRDKRKRNTAGIPHREVIIPVPESEQVCSCCGKEKAVIGHECRQELNYQPAVFEIVTEKREKRACKNGCEGQLVVAPLRERVLPKCKASESLLAYICVSKVLDRQPLYHLEKSIEQRHGWHIARHTMSRWMIMLAEKLQPLVNRMKDIVLDYDICAIDATSFQVLNEPERAAHVKSNAYCIRGGPPTKKVILYEYNAYRQGEYVDETLTDFKGYIECDASPVFNRIGNQPHITLSYCHAHARRKFEQVEKAAQKGKAKLATEALRIYSRLYAVERDATQNHLTPAQRHELRQTKSRPILNEFHAWLIRNQAQTLPKSPIGQAIAYTLDHWDGLQTYLSDGRLEIDNNATERQIKPFVIARKNFLFACTQDGADSLAVHFSLILTARLHGLDPMRYYTELLKQIPSASTFEQFDRLLPWNFVA